LRQRGDRTFSECVGLAKVRGLATRASGAAQRSMNSQRMLTASGDRMGPVLQTPTVAGAGEENSEVMSLTPDDIVKRLEKQAAKRVASPLPLRDYFMRRGVYRARFLAIPDEFIDSENEEDELDKALSACRLGEGGSNAHPSAKQGSPRLCTHLTRCTMDLYILSLCLRLHDQNSRELAPERPGKSSRRSDFG
jgi:hypothetical protein